MTVGIYGLFDSVTGECLYIGQSSDIEYRVKHHLKRLRSGNHLSEFNSWFMGEGKDLSRIRVEILEECEDSDYTKNLLEIKWFYAKVPKFYGKVPSTKESWGMSQTTKNKISEGLRTYSKNQRGGVPRLVDRVLKCALCEKEYTSPRRSSTYCSTRCQATQVDEEKVDIMVDLYNAGKSTRYISDVVGFSYKTVSRHLRRRGVPLRGRGASK